MIEEIRKDFFEFELRNDVFSLEIANVQFWPLIRFRIFSLIRQHILNEGSGTQKSRFTSILPLFKATINHLVKNNLKVIKTADHLLLWGHPRRKKMEDGLWWDLYLDPLIEEFDWEYELIEPPFGDKHFKPSKSLNISYFNGFGLYHKLLKKIRKVNFSDTELLVINKLESDIEKYFNIRLNLKKEISNELITRNLHLPFFLKVLMRNPPKALIVMVSYYSPYIIESAKKLNIPVIELQHGTIYPSHLGYSYPIKIESIFLPDYYFLFGEFWKQNANFPIADKNVLITGYPFFSINKEKVEKKIKAQNKDNSILFISQWTIGKELSQLALDLIKINPALKIKYKLHGGEYNSWKEQYPWLVNSGIIVIDNDADDLYTLILKSKCIVGVYSTALYEALGLGKYIYIYNLPSSNTLKPIFENELVSLISSAEELSHNLIENNFSASKTNSDYFFNSNWKILFPSALKEVLDYKT